MTHLTSDEPPSWVFTVRVCNNSHGVLTAYGARAQSWNGIVWEFQIRKQALCPCVGVLFSSGGVAFQRVLCPSLGLSLRRAKPGTPGPLHGRFRPSHLVFNTNGGHFLVLLKGNHSSSRKVFGAWPACSNIVTSSGSSRGRQ